MGGYGSGRRQSLDRHRQVESCLILDADTIPRPIVAGSEGDIDLTLRLAPDRVHCSYLLRCDARGFELVLWTPAGTPWLMSRIRLDHVPSVLGGARPYLLCPSCRSRALKLYWPLEDAGGLGCRTLPPARLSQLSGAPGLRGEAAGPRRPASEALPHAGSGAAADRPAARQRRRDAGRGGARVEASSSGGRRNRARLRPGEWS